MCDRETERERTWVTERKMCGEWVCEKERLRNIESKKKIKGWVIKRDRKKERDDIPTERKSERSKDREGQI